MVFESKEEVKEEIKEDDNRLSEETIPQKKEEYVTLYGQVDVALPIFPQIKDVFNKCSQYNSPKPKCEIHRRPKVRNCL